MNEYDNTRLNKALEKEIGWQSANWDQNYPVGQSDAGEIAL